MEGVFTSYFHNLFSSSMPSDFAEIFFSFGSIVSPDMMIALSMDFTWQEVHLALK